MYDEAFWENFNFYEALKSSLEDAIAYERGEIALRKTIVTEDGEFKTFLGTKDQTPDDVLADSQEA